MKLRPFLFLSLVIATFAALPGAAHAQPMADTSDSSAAAVAATSPGETPYVRPTQQIKLRNYVFDTFGPYPVVGAAMVAGIGQIENTPPAWGQGAAGYSRRFGSDLGIAAISTTTRYALAEALKEDTLYYRCECTGVFPRLGHVILSSFTARHGEDGHRAFSYSAVAAPYAWYPGAFNTRYALRLGNLNMLAAVGQNFLMEFFYSGPHSLLTRMHLDNPNAAAAPEPAK
jgi:hypothetical protein